MQQILFILFFFCSSAIIAQSDIKGRVLDQQGVAIIGANVFIEGSYDGSVTDENGDFPIQDIRNRVSEHLSSAISLTKLSKKRLMCLLCWDLPSS